LEIEVGKTMLYVIAAVLISTVVQSIVRQVEEDRKAWILLRTDLTEGLLNLYLRAKGTRRRLRAILPNEDGVIEVAKYVELIEDLIEIQLGLERYTRQAKAGVRAGIVAESVHAELDGMEKYLHELVQEYENVHASEGATIRLADLGKLADFTKRSLTSNFHSEFANRFDRAAQAIAETNAPRPLIRSGESRN